MGGCRVYGGKNGGVVYLGTLVHLVKEGILDDYLATNSYD